MNPYLLAVPLVLQGAIVIIDEIFCHAARDLPVWERRGHPLDTYSVVACLALLLCGASPGVYGVACLLSCLFVTKDEWIHVREDCSGFEHWLHALLFTFHPVCLMAAYFLAQAGAWTILWVVTSGAFLLGTAKGIYWNLVRPLPGAQTEPQVPLTQRKAS